MVGRPYCTVLLQYHESVWSPKGIFLGRVVMKKGLYLRKELEGRTIPNAKYL